MPNVQQTNFPTLQSIMDLARSIVNDMYAGVGGTNGRILTNNAPFTIPFINSALATINRKLRNEGVTFPIIDNFILENLTPVQNPDPSIQVSIGFEGYFDGKQTHATPALPPDCLQVLDVWEQTVGSNLPFAQMAQPQGGLVSTFQGPWLSVWEWRQYKIWMLGSIQAKNLRLRYQSGQAPFNTPPADFNQTVVAILDCTEAMAAEIAHLYGLRTGGGNTQLAKDMRDEAIDDMANEWVRRQQNQNFRRPAYNGGGSNDTGTPLGPVGNTQGA